MQRIDEDPVRLMRAYLEAEYRATIAGRPLVLAIGGHPPAWCDDDLVVLTAWNPRSMPRADAENAAALESLRRALAPHAQVHEAIGCDAARTSWAEPSLLAIGLSLDIADREARRHDQNATVTARCRGRVRLRMYRTEWRDAVEAACLDTRFVDWVASPAPA